MAVASAAVNSVQGNTGLPRTTVIIGLLVFMFVAFTAARGTLVKYKTFLFGAKI